MWKALERTTNWNIKKLFKCTLFPKLHQQSFQNVNTHCWEDFDIVIQSVDRNINCFKMCQNFFKK